MNLHHLKVFHAVAQTGNFSHAAQLLYISQPAVSVQVRRLEEALGVPLVEVYSRRVHLTAAGVRLKEFADQIFRLDSDAEAAMAEFQDPSRGTVRVGASTTPGTYLLPKAIAGFRRQYPGVQVHLQLGNTRAIEEKLLANDLDLGVVGEDMTAEGGLLLEPWITDRMVIIAAPEYIRPARPTSLEQLIQHPFILREPGSSTREVFVAHVQSLGLRIAPAFELSSAEVVKEAVAAGLGVAVVSVLSVQAEQRAGRLVVLDVADLQLERQLHLARHKGKHLSRAGAAFLSFLQEFANEHRQGDLP